ncbi:hypothetical protein CFC21_004658 [Triticum aestivum]|uniref:NB-ARC domain-containing protein n=3 Tax=Triticum TaxID=4564 RepID=A0A9R0QIU5_TRITD|nr:uncharacterized protein LOC123102670 [Triticum aestivum]KAF6986978.1 hypothetical protein CFC21_004658 [Triticum aestivum]VAH12007.1 unnamed protein product [Triticum turgidum subsp. durum]
MRPDTPWIVGLTSLMVAWFVNPILAYYVPKILSAIGLGASKRLSDLETHIIPELKKTLCGVDQARMMERESKEKDDLAMLNKMAARLRHALEDAEDISDDQQEIESYRNTFPQCLWSGLNIGWGWIAPIVWSGQAWLWRWVRKISFRLSEVTANAAATCVVICMPVTQIVRSGFDSLLQWAQMISSAVATCVAGFNISCTCIADILQSARTRLSMLALRGSNHRLPEYRRPVTGTSVAASDETALPDPEIYSERVVDSDGTSREPVPEICSEGTVSDEPSTSALLHGPDDRLHVTDNNVTHSHQRVPGTNVSALDETIPAEIHPEAEPRTTSELAPDEPALLDTNDAASQGAVPENSITRFSMWIASLGPWLSRCRTSIHNASENATTFRDETCEGIGFTSHKEDASALDSVLTVISIWKLKRKIKKIESTGDDVKKSPLYVVAKESELEDIANKNRPNITTASNQMVFGRQSLLDVVVKRLLNQPTSSGKCYSAFGIHGVSGSGKTTFARYTRDYIKNQKQFDPIMCVHLSKNSSVDGIFQKMLDDIAREQHTNISDGEKLQEKLEESVQGKNVKDKLENSLRGKCFFLILDDLWAEERTNKQLNELLSPLDLGQQGSKILVTAQIDTAAKVLCDDNITVMPDMHEERFYEMFMHHALSPEGEHEHDEERKKLGRLIAEKLPKSPIAAVIVAGQLRLDYRIEFWRRTAKRSKFVNTWDALWWSYQKLPLDIRRCLEYCNIFPRRTNLKTEDLVRLWIAQGFVKPSASEDMEDIAEGYVQKLASCSFLKPTMGRDDCFTIHDLLHDLLDEVVGSDCFRIENERSQEEGPWRIEKDEGPSRIEKEEGWSRDVRYLFVQNYDAELIIKMVLRLKNLRTLIIYIVRSDTPVEEMVIESICKRLLKLRVLIIHFSNTIFEDHDRIFSFPKSVGQLKHLRYLGFRSSAWAVILPSTLNKLHHIQELDFGCLSIVNPKFTGCLINLLHIICQFCYFPHIGRMISLKTLPHFRVRDEEGYEVEQLRYLNKLRGTLMIDGLENVKSKEQADQANLAVKEQLTELYLVWARGGGTRCSPKDEAEVLEGLCPPVGLQSLTICCYDGSRYPDWMVGRHNCGPKDLQQLHFWRCNQTAPCLELETFHHLRELWLIYCSWDTLPDNMENLTSLKLLRIFKCLNIRSLPTLPKSLEVFELDGCNDELTAEHAIWKKNKRMSKTSSDKTNDWDSASYVRFMMTRLFLP